MAVVGCRSSMQTVGASYATHALSHWVWLGRSRRTPETCTCRSNIAKEAEVPLGLARFLCGAGVARNRANRSARAGREGIRVRTGWPVEDVVGDARVARIRVSRCARAERERHLNPHGVTRGGCRGHWPTGLSGWAVLSELTE